MTSKPSRPMRVYLSSTSQDLKPFRAAVLAALRKQGHDRFVVVAQEDYPSESDLPVDKCRNDVKTCDVYVGLFAWRYGFIPPGFDRSITDLEYREALDRDLETLVFLADEDAAISPRFVDKGPNAERIQRLRDELGTRHVIAQPLFKTPEEVALQVVTALTALRWPRPAIDLDRLRVFLCAPGSCGEQRATLRQAVEDAAARCAASGTRLEVVTWPSLEASDRATPPEEELRRGLRSPTKCDLLLMALWDETGPLLAPPVVSPDGRPCRTAAEWALWSSLHAAARAEAGRPAVLVYRQDQEPPFSIRAPDVLERVQRFRELEQLLEEVRRCPRAAVRDFTTPEQLRRLAADDVEREVRRLATLVGRDDPEERQDSAERKVEQEAADRWLRPYLQWVVDAHSILGLPGIREAAALPVPLEQVYVALRGDRAGAYEVAASHDVLQRELESLHDEFQWLSEAERRKLRACLLRQAPSMLSLLERDRPGQARRSITLAEAFRQERQLVILGDPGSGKTTLSRWLALKLARALGEQQDRKEAGDLVQVPVYQVNPDAPYDHRLISLGPARLPILVRVAKFAQALTDAKKGGKELLLVDWLCHVSWNEQPPSAGERIPVPGLDRLFRHFLRQGRAVVLLDGMDEITEQVERRDVVQAIEQFVRDWAPLAGSWRDPLAPGGPLVIGPPGEVGGNQVVVTSRIAGYHAAPLAVVGTTHVTIEPMRRPAVEHFCDSWMKAVFELRHPDDPPQERQVRAVASAAGLKQAIFEKGGAGIEEIASNPLLVTILASLYLRRGTDLPGTRVELYQTAIEMLIEHWRGVNLSREEVLFVLAPLAAYIHEHYATGLVEESELRQIVTERLALYRDQPADNPPPRLAEAVRRFIETMRDQVGLIAARGERLYGFLHLTFQEYLAGCHLTRNPLQAEQEIIARMGEPRWREPILLALGRAAREWSPPQRSRLFEAMLTADDPLGNFLPRAALLVVDALREMGQLPESSFRLLVRRLLSASADRESRERFPALRQRLEEAFLRVRVQGNREWLDEELAEAIRAPAAPDLAPAAAALVRENVWYSASIVQALVDGLEHDSAGWDWPIERGLLDLVSPALPDQIHPASAPPDAEVRKVQDRLRRLETGELLAEEEARLQQLDSELAEREAERDHIAEQDRSTREALALAQKEQREEAAEELAARLEEGEQRGTRLRQWFAGREQLQAELLDLRGGGKLIRERLLGDLDEAVRELQKRQAEDPVAYERQARRHGIYTSACARRDLHRAQRERAAVPISPSSLRRALERDADSLALVRGNVHWLALIAGTCGGYPNHRAALVEREYTEIATFLSRSDAEREEILDSAGCDYVGRFGGEDTVYQAAVYLDVKMNGRLALARKLPAFTPAAIYRPSALDDLVVNALAARSAPGVLAGALRDIWRHSPSPRARVDALVALTALGEDVSQDLSAAVASPEQRGAAETALGQLQRVVELLADAVFRSREELLANLETLGEEDPAVWADVVQVVLRGIAAAGQAPIKVDRLAAAAPLPYRHALRADQWYARFNATEEPADAIGSLLQDLPAADDLVALLAAAHRAPSRSLDLLPSSWEVEPVPPRFEDDGLDVPTEVLEALGAIHLGHIRAEFEVLFADAGLARLAERAQRNPQVGPDLAAFAFTTGCTHRLDDLVPVPDAEDFFQSLIETANRPPDPYYRARALIGFAPWLPEEERQRQLSLARRTAAEIASAHRRTRVLELLIPHAGADEAAVIEEAIASAREVPDPDQRCRALVRLSRRVEGERALALWAQALDAISAVSDEDARAETLQTIGPFVPDQADLKRRWRALGEALASPTARARATNRLACRFLRSPPASLEAKVRANPEIWAPVLLAEALRELLAAVQEETSIRGLWTALGERPADRGLVGELLERGGEMGLSLTPECVRAVESLHAAGERESLSLLLPLLHSPVAEVMPALNRWRFLPEDLLAQHAVLALAEPARRINGQTIPRLLELLSSGLDRSRCRAHLVFRSRIWNLLQKPQFALSQIGAEALEQLAEMALLRGNQDVGIRSFPLYLMAHMVCDDPEAIDRWVSWCGAGGRQGDVGDLLLSGLWVLSDDAWPALLRGLGEGNERARGALLESLCVMAVSKNCPTEQGNAVCQVLRSLPGEALAFARVVAEPKAAVGRVAVEIAGRKLDPHQQASGAERLFEDQSVCLSETIRTSEDAGVLELFAAIGNSMVSWLDGSDPQAEAGALEIVGHPDAFPVLLRWLSAALAAPGQREARRWDQRTAALLAVTAAVVRRMPSAFAKHVEPGKLVPLLLAVAEWNEHRYGRRDAITLLAHLRRITPEVLRAFLRALRDDRHVQDEAIDSANQLQEITPAALSLLLRALSDDSAVLAYGASRMLSAIGRQERLEDRQRRQILTGLADAIRDRRSARGIYRFAGLGGAKDDPVRVARFGRLDQAFHRAILEITGVVGPSDG